MFCLLCLASLADFFVIFHRILIKTELYKECCQSSMYSVTKGIISENDSCPSSTKEHSAVSMYDDDPRRFAKEIMW